VRARIDCRRVIDRRRKICGLIPARGGSKGIPRKNIKVLAGKPLIAWTIEQALASGSLDSVVVTTDDEEIAEVARRYGAAVPFLRPPELARDDTPSLDPVLHAMDRLTDHDALVLLQPTSPLRTAGDIDGCVELALSRELDSVVSVCEPGKHPMWMYRMDKEQHLSRLIEGPEYTRRQDLPLVYAVNGALYFSDFAWLRRTRKFVTADSVGYVMPAERSIDLDTPLDWRLAEAILEERSVGSR